jgi:hypothetical protein
MAVTRGRFLGYEFDRTVIAKVLIEAIALESVG